MDTHLPAGAGPGTRWDAAMKAGDFAAAWAISDAVLARRDPATRDDPRLPNHQRWVWDGTPPDGLDVLVRCYHGLGDTLQFARLLPALCQRAARVTLQAPAALLPVLPHPPGLTLVAFDPAHPLPPSACDIEIMELGHVLRLTPEEAGACVPYVRARRSPLLHPPGAQILGLCWQAGEWDSARSVPYTLLREAVAKGDAGRLRPLVSLQRGPAALEAYDPAFLNPRDTDMDFRRTAALIGGCAVVITVDTMVAHLAGALGRAVILLLKYNADWRWPDPGQPSPWYPSMTIVRQRASGDWRAPLRELSALLAAMA